MANYNAAVAATAARAAGMQRKPPAQQKPAQRVADITSRMADRGKPGTTRQPPQKPGMNQTPGTIGRTNPQRPMPQAKPPAPGPQVSTTFPAPQAPEPPVWQQLKAAGIGGQGSAAANRAMLAGLPPQAQGTFTPGGSPMARPGGLPQGPMQGHMTEILNAAQPMPGGAQGQFTPGGSPGRMPQGMRDIAQAQQGVMGPSGPFQQGGGIMPMGANLPPEVAQMLQGRHFGGLPGGNPQLSSDPATLGQGMDQMAQIRQRLQQMQPSGGMQQMQGGGLQAPPQVGGGAPFNNAPGALDAYFAPQMGRGYAY